MQSKMHIMRSSIDNRSGDDDSCIEHRMLLSWPTGTGSTREELRVMWQRHIRVNSGSWVWRGQRMSMLMTIVWLSVMTRVKWRRCNVTIVDTPLININPHRHQRCHHHLHTFRHLTIYTVFHKMWHFISAYNCGQSWQIFIIFVLL